MEVVSRIDEQGRFVEDVILREDDLPEGCVQSRPPEGFYAPRWSGSGWAEGKPPGEILEGLKAAKVGEMAARAIDELAPMFTPGKGRDETALLVAGHVLKICEALKIPPDPRLRAVVETSQWALAKKEEVEAATTVEALEAVTWTQRRENERTYGRRRCVGTEIAVSGNWRPNATATTPTTRPRG